MENYLTQITNYLLMQSWQIAVLVVVIAAVSLTLKNRSAHVRYLLWLIILAKCLVPPLFTIPLAVLPQERYAEPVPISSSQMPTVAFETVDTSAAETPVSPAVAVPAPTVTEKAARLTTLQWLVFVWVAGVAAFFLFAVIKALRTNRWLRRDRKPLPAELQSGIKNLFPDVGGIKVFPKVWLVNGIGQPFVWGLLRGGIYLPADFVKIDSDKHRRSVLGHEFSHILRFDAAVNILQIIAQAVFWFHPFVWWANKKIRAEREKCCDEMAIARLGTKVRDYSIAVVNTLVVEHESAWPVPSLAVAGPVKNIEERIKTIMKPGKKFYKRPSLIAVTVVLLLALLIVPTALVLTARAETEVTMEREDKPTKSLHEAAKDGDVEQVKLLISKGVDVNVQGNKGGTPLHSAAWNGRKDVVEVLLEHGADINALQEGWTPLHNAARSGNWDLVALLMTKGAKAESGVGEKGYGTAKGATALHIAAHYSSFEVAERLIAKGIDVHIRDEEGNTPLHTAATWAQKPEMVELLISKGADVNAKNKVGRIPLHGAPLFGPQALKKVNLLIAHGSEVNVRDQEGWTPLHRVAGSGFVEIVQVLIANGADVNAETTDGRKPLDEALKVKFIDLGGRQLEVADVLLKNGTDVSNINLAAYAGDLEKVREFLAKGVNVNTKNASELMPLHAAASGGNKEVTAFLIAEGANVNAEGFRDKTPLHYAAIAGHGDIAELLIVHGADIHGTKINAKQDFGWTPLHEAAFYSQRDVVKVLLDNGAKVNMKGGVNGRTPLADAIDRGSKEVVELLIARGADVNAGVLYRAAGYGHKDIVEMLIAEGADVNAKNKWGWTPLDAAVLKGCTEIVELLRKHGAKE